jgi:hypothetical protein
MKKTQKKSPKRRNVFAHALNNPIFKNRIVPGTKGYVRKSKHKKTIDMIL